MTTESVSFYLPKLTDPHRFDTVDPETDWTPFRSARGQSIPHTYVRLRQAGHEVRLTNQPPPEGIVVVFAGDMRRYRAARSRTDRCTVVCVQTDRRVPEVSLADVLVQHNGLKTDNRRRFFIPNWPQPGLIPREVGRGSTIRTVSYKGALANLRHEFLSHDWARLLADLDLTFVVDADVSAEDGRLTPLSPSVQIGSTAAWHDYSASDVVLAVRPHRRDGYAHKPAVKLINAWRAGTPALLGPERAYLELRQSELDFLEVASPGEAAAALSRLRDDPALYEHMVANGLERSARFSVAGITQQWETLLFETLSHWKPKRLPRLTAPATVPARRAFRGLQRRVRSLGG